MKPSMHSRIIYVLLLSIVGILAVACQPIAPLAETSSDPGITADSDRALASIAQSPVRHPFQDEVLYFVLPDRFANGDPGNDTGGIDGDRLDHGFDPTDKGFYHGGDLAGLLQKLDYLESMGVTAIWMTPMFVNQPVQGPSHDLSAGYHGYWITDFTRFDPHFGANEELEELIEAASQREIDIYFDIITNHTADVLKTGSGEYGYLNKGDFPYKDSDGNEFDDRVYVGEPKFPELDVKISFPYTPTFDIAGDAVRKTPGWLNDPIYYHNRGNTTFSGEDSLYGDFFGLDDLFTEHPDVVDGMIDIYTTWVQEYGIAGFRIDTVKHVNIEFWQAFSEAINDAAIDAGKEDFFFFGEVFSGNPGFLSYFSTQTEMPAVLDFGFQEQIRDYVSKQSDARNLADFFAADDLYIDADSNAYLLPSFTGNHDRGRFGHFLVADHGNGLSEEDLLKRTKLAHAMINFARGVPVIYYGDEQGFTGSGNDKDARQDMFASQVSEYADPAINRQIGANGTPAEDNFQVGHPIYAALAEYAAIYQQHDALRRGAQIHRYADEGRGIYAFSRIDRDEQIETVVAFNNDSVARSVTFDVFSPNMEYRSVYPAGLNVVVTSDEVGRLTVNVPALGFVIWRAVAPLDNDENSRAETPGITMVSPVSGREVVPTADWIDGFSVPNRLELRAELDQENVFAEVTFAVRQIDRDEWTPIGVDDNPPYRVFYDAGVWPDGTVLDFAAVVNDLGGGYDMDSATGVTVVSQSPSNPDQPGIGDGPDYAIVHYLRSEDDYGDHTSDNSENYWGLHLWGEAIDPAETTDWQSPKPFLGETDAGRFAWVKLQDGTKDVNFIVHRGDSKDGAEADRSFNPSRDGHEIWLRENDAGVYSSQAAAQGFVTIYYQRNDSVYDGWGLHLWGEVLAEGVDTAWTAPRAFDGIDAYGAFWQVPIQNADAPLGFIVHRGDEKDPGLDQQMVPDEGAHAYVRSGDETVYRQLGDAENYVTIHYHRPDGDYGDATRDDFNDFWGLHTWAAADDPGWTTPRRPDGADSFGLFYMIPLTDRSRTLGYIHHRGDSKDPGPDQFLDVAEDGFEVWQIQGAPADDQFLPIHR